VGRVKVTATNKYSSKTTFMPVVSECTDFYPIVTFFPSPENSIEIKNNLIFIYEYYFSDPNNNDPNNNPYQPFLKEMTAEYKHLPDGRRSFVPYFRMWNSQKEDRTFKLRCYVFNVKNNCANKGDIHVEMSNPVNGLSINNLEDNTVKGAENGKTFTLDLLLTKDVDRTPTAIDEVPLIFYVENKGEKTEVGRIHLSVAPKDVFSAEETQKTHNYLFAKPRYTNGHDCITAVRVGLEKLLGTSLKGAINFLYNSRKQKHESFHIWDIEGYLEKKGYLKKSIEIRMEKKGGSLEPETENESPLSLIQEEIGSNIGYHVFGIGVSGIHTETLIINYSNPATPVFSMFDQYGFVEQEILLEKEKETKKILKDVPLEDINDVVSFEISTWVSYAETKKKKPEYKMLLLKVCRSLLLFLALFFSCCNNNTIRRNNSDIYVSDSLKTLSVDSTETKDTLNRFDELLNLLNQSCFKYISSVEIMDVEKSRGFDNWVLDTEKSKLAKWKNRKEYFTQCKRVNFDFGKTMKPYGTMWEYRFDSLKYAEKYVNYLRYEIHGFAAKLDDSNSRIYKLNDAYYHIFFFKYDGFKGFSDFLIRCDSLKWDFKWDLN
jgi:hypothetical protein